ncbi:hypothetical protein M3Y94_00671500 [Aphelenchoides besseyi]|nr:hypothetical protein M3Y94_00671500 [Aphelenchoides besseyi]KAI6231346.1 7TM-GPCR-Srx domain-containing protein [Aphelenchoides besseyi]
MTVKLENLIVGLILAAASLFVVVLNSTVIFVLLRCGLHKRNGIYVLAFANLIGDTVQQIVTLIYVAPSSIFQDFLVGKDEHSPAVLFFAYVFLFMWYEGMWIQGAIAVDRLLNVVFIGVARLASIRTYFWISTAIYVLSALMAVWSQLLSPCCTVYVFYGAFGYSYLGSSYNYADHFVDLPLNSTVTILMFVCYAWIYFFVRRSNRQISVTGDEMAKRKAKEIKFATQFSIIASVLAFTWISFRVFPMVIRPEMGIPQLYSLVTLALTFHCSTNATIFLSMNSEFRRNYLKTFGFSKLPSSQTATEVSKTHY